MRCLIIYFSKTGNTAIVAETIKKELKAHTQEIHDFTDNRTVLEYLFPTVFDSASINPRKYDVGYYETIFIGTPVWAASITPAIYKFIKENDFKSKDIVLFNTMKKVGGKIALKHMAKHVKNSNGHIIGSFTIRSDVDKDVMIQNTKRAIKELNL